MKLLYTHTQRIGLIVGVLLAMWGFNTLDWIFNSPVKAWEQWQIAPGLFILCWICYALGVLSLFFGALLIGLMINYGNP